MEGDHHPVLNSLATVIAAVDRDGIASNAASAIAGAGYAQCIEVSREGCAYRAGGTQGCRPIHSRQGD